MGFWIMLLSGLIGLGLVIFGVKKVVTVKKY